MALGPEDIAIVRTTRARVAPVASRLFYDRLFRIAPETRALFADDMKAQGRKLMATLRFGIDHLDRPDALTPAARALALRHLDYDVTADQYAPVGEALIWSLQELLGPAFGKREKAAWLAAYTALSSLMIDAAYGTPAAGRGVQAAAGERHPALERAGSGRCEIRPRRSKTLASSRYRPRTARQEGAASGAGFSTTPRAVAMRPRRPVTSRQP